MKTSTDFLKQDIPKQWQKKQKVEFLPSSVAKQIMNTWVLLDSLISYTQPNNQG